MSDQKRLSHPYSESDLMNWLAGTVSHKHYLNRTLIENACHFIQQHQTNTDTQHNTIQLGLAMADILLDITSDTHAIVAGLLLPTALHANVSSDQLTEHFNADIDHLIQGVAQMTTAEAAQGLKPTSDKQHIDNLKKMLLVIIDDVRIVILKLTQQIVSLHSVKQSLLHEQQQLAKQTMELYAPLANRLGIGQLKWQLEDLAFRYTEPEQYKKLSSLLNMKRKERDDFIQRMIAQLIALLHQEDIQHIDVTGRSKHIYSIHRKIEKKKVPFNEIFDASALRILVPTTKDCYTALGIIHATWPPIKEEFDDYISQPKPNGYQSIHTAVTCDNKLNVEIQIRTHDMHHASELGVAAHWKYKEGGNTTDNYEDKIATLRQVIDWQKDLSRDDSETPETTSLNAIFDDRIYVLSPQGHVYDLPVGATPLDFAYLIHSQVGNRCKGAKVNGKLEPLNHPLSTGDQVDIMTSKQDNPSLDWLNPTYGYITTKQARSKIKSWFRKQDFEKFLSVGQDIWDKARKKGRYTKKELAMVCKDFNVNSEKDLIAAIGAGDVQMSTVIQHIDERQTTTEEPKPEDSITPTHTPKRHTSSNNQIIGADNMMTQLARCCKPIPGDHIVGYITQGRGITIHKTRCGNIKQAKKKNPERLIDIDWNPQAPQHVVMGIQLVAQDRSGLIRDITATLDKHQGTIIGLSSHVDTLNDTAYIDLTVEMKEQGSTQRILQALGAMPDTLSVKRG